jgi:hypothetical protein
MYVRLRTLIVLLLVLMLPLQALASVTPSLLLSHSHPTTASTAVYKHHAYHHSPYGVAEQHSHPVDHHGNSVSSPDHQGLADECSCAWCTACPIPVTTPSLLDDLSASLYAPITPHLSHYIPDQLQPPPRV